MDETSIAHGRLILWCAVVAVLGSSGCGTVPEGRPAPGPAEVVAAHVVKKTIVEWDEFVGRLEPVETVEVRARVNGYLRSISFKEGQIVKAGDLLCVIDPRPFEAEVARANAVVDEANTKISQAGFLLAAAESDLRVQQTKFDLATKQAERYQHLASSGGVPVAENDVRRADAEAAKATVDQSRSRVAVARSEVTMAEAALKTARSNLGIAALNLEYTRVYAPISGRISRRVVTEGNLVTGGTAQSTLLTTIVLLDPIHCVIDADEASYLKYMRLAQQKKAAELS